MNILTFDIEDWYNCDFISEDFDWDKFEYCLDKAFMPVLDEMDRRDLKSTCFCLGWLAEKHPNIIKEIAKRGHQIGCHSYQHELSFRFTPEHFIEDTLKSKQLLEDVTGQAVDVFRAPGFSITEKNPCDLVLTTAPFSILTLLRISIVEVIAFKLNWRYFLYLTFVESMLV